MRIAMLSLTMAIGLCSGCCQMPMGAYSPWGDPYAACLEDAPCPPINDHRHPRRQRELRRFYRQLNHESAYGNSPAMYGYGGGMDGYEMEGGACGNGVCMNGGMMMDGGMSDGGYMDGQMMGGFPSGDGGEYCPTCQQNFQHPQMQSHMQPQMQMHQPQEVYQHPEQFQMSPEMQPQQMYHPPIQQPSMAPQQMPQPTLAPMPAQVPGSMNSIPSNEPHQAPPAAMSPTTEYFPPAQWQPTTPAHYPVQSFTPQPMSVQQTLFAP